MLGVQTVVHWPVGPVAPVQYFACRLLRVVALPRSHARTRSRYCTLQPTVGSGKVQ